MNVFVISFFVYMVFAFAIGIGILFRGRSMHAGCQKLSKGTQCKSRALCSGACRKVQ